MTSGSPPRRRRWSSGRPEPVHVPGMIVSARATARSTCSCGRSARWRSSSPPRKSTKMPGGSCTGRALGRTGSPRRWRRAASAAAELGMVTVAEPRLELGGQDQVHEHQTPSRPKMKLKPVSRMSLVCPLGLQGVALPRRDLRPQDGT